ncbi:tetratricopeptide repeat protein [Nocardiopsis sp. NPDC049922]|uniref:serine/threonine-protein kinase n=1 Tax=Nocardiopsis sp. NPDC049922 TaxID=3155157 RepID=UPI0033C36D8C
MTMCVEPGCDGGIQDGQCGVCGRATGDDALHARTRMVPLEPSPATQPVPRVPPSGAPSVADAPPPQDAPVDGPAPEGQAPGGRAPRSAPHSEPPGDGGVVERWLTSGAFDADRTDDNPVESHPIFDNVRIAGRIRPGGTDGVRGTGAGSAGTSRGSARGMLGMGMVQVPLVPYRDPTEAVLSRPVVAEHNRLCGSCGDRVGRSRDGRPGRTEGYCRSCGTRFSFTPKLSRGDLVGGQYEVLGCIAHGGLGWIYLARDRNVNDRWVVLKGLLNAGDAAAHRAAAAERAFLSEVEHPNIVKIINFSHHPDPDTGIPSGHIVMEYVGGKSLRQLLMERRERGAGDEVLPVDQVIAFGLESLRALDHLHRKGLLYCDFKPDNVMQSEEQIKLIDLGGVRRMEDTSSHVYSTPGYRVPEDELRSPGPSVSSDLYSVGRTLAVLSFRFDAKGEHQHTLPPRETVPLLVRHESFDRLLRRSTHAEPRKRFHDAADMSDQLTGVLREVLSELDGTPHPEPSALFGGENTIGATAVGAIDADRLLTPPSPTDAAALLPKPQIDPADPAAQHLRGFSALSPEELVPILQGMAVPSPETQLMLCRALITVGRHAEAMDALHRFSEASPADWRTDWYLAVAELSTGRFQGARALFDRIYDHLPGESAPKLGLALASERTGDHETAARQYRTVWNTDHSFVSAAFGLARIRLAQDDRAEAIRVLDTVPELSSQYVHAQTALVSVLSARHGATDAKDFLEAGQRLDRLGLDGESTDRLAVRVLENVLVWLGGGGRAPADRVLLRAPLSENGVRANLERRYRAMAYRAASVRERRELVDKANSLRPVTLL